MRGDARSRALAVFAIAVAMLAMAACASGSSAPGAPQAGAPPQSLSSPDGNLTHAPPATVVIPPIVENETFTFELQCDYDGSDVMFISVVYSQDGVTDLVATMAHEPWQASGNYRAWLELLPSIGNLTYHIHLETDSGEDFLYPSSGNYTVPVVDTTPPTVAKDDMGFMPGMLITVWYYIDDNVGIASAKFTYRFPGQTNWTTRDLPSVAPGKRGLRFLPWYTLGDILCYVEVSDGTHQVRFPATGYDAWPIMDDTKPMILHYTSTMTDPVYMVTWTYSYHGLLRNGEPRDTVPRATAGLDIPFVLGFYENGLTVNSTLYYWTSGEDVLAHSVDLETVWHDANNGTFLASGTVPSIDRETTLSFSIRATDAYGNSAYYKYYKFNISIEDLTKPVIERVYGSAEDIIRNGTIRVKASDDLGVRSVVLVIDADLNDTAFNQYAMIEEGGGWYYFPVPDVFVEMGEFHYFILVKDGSTDVTQQVRWPTGSGTSQSSYSKVALSVEEPDTWTLWTILACLAVPTALLVILPEIVKK